MRKTLILKLTLIFILLIFVTLVSGAQPLLDQPINKVDLRAGETLEYSVKVKGIPAGSQIMQIKGQKTIGGKTVYHLQSYSSANSFFYLFYPFSDQVESYVLKDNFQPVKFQRHLIDGKYNGSTTINFDNSKLVAEIVKDKKRFEVKIPDGVQDELSMLYLIRLRKIEVGNEYEFSAIVGSKVYNIVVQVLRTEEIKTVFGKTKTMVLRSMPKDALLWITNDENRIPVRLEINTKIGKLVADLKAMS
ncbi:MAG: DUF3108 domain-containing protein [Candidatus Poribacteria bacterium]